jgi:cyanophycinase
MLGLNFARGTDPKAGPIPSVPPEGIKGSLVIVGGGAWVDGIQDTFLELAGGKGARLVVIPTANGKADRPELLTSYTAWKAKGVASVVVLHTLRPEQANDLTFVKPLTQATGVWFAGGDQSRLMTSYRGTGVERELKKLLSRGGVIGGISAGAAVMSPVMITGGKALATVGEGFGLLPGCVVDQHFMNRQRLHRLLGVLDQYPGYVGLGIDEETAVVVHGRILTVLGNQKVHVCIPGSDGKAATSQVLKMGDRLDFISLCQTASQRARPVLRGEAARTPVPTVGPRPSSPTR